MKTEITSWVDQYNGKTYYALRVYEKGYLQWQSEPCMDEESAKARLICELLENRYSMDLCFLLSHKFEYIIDAVEYIKFLENEQ